MRNGFVRLYPVTEGRCPCCGRREPVWTPAAVLQAMRDWHRTTGRAPTSVDWQRAGKGHPSASWIIQIFGSFASARELAGLRRPRKVGVTHCKHGHEFTPANTWVNGRGRRECRVCRARKAREWRARAAT